MNGDIGGTWSGGNHRDRVEQCSPGAGVGNGEVLFNGYKVSICRMGRVLEMDGGAGPPNYTLKHG